MFVFGLYEISSWGEMHSWVVDGRSDEPHKQKLLDLGQSMGSAKRGTERLFNTLRMLETEPSPWPQINHKELYPNYYKSGQFKY